MGEALEATKPLGGVPGYRPSRWTYIRYALLHPGNLLFLVALLALGSASESVALVLTGVAIEVCGAVALTRWGAFRRLVEMRLAYEHRLERGRVRDERLLEVEGRYRDELSDLTSVVEEVERSDYELARYLDLQELLDSYIDLAIAHSRCVTAMGCTDRQEIGANLGSLAGESDGSKLAALRKQRKSILVRRARHWDACRERALELEEELAAVADFVRLAGQKALCPDVEEEVSEELDRRLGDLQETESALRRLNAA